MAQLRDARTSALLAEGTPVEVALASKDMDSNTILFDDVGEGFDPDAVIEQHNQTLSNLQTVREDDEQDDEVREAAQRAIEDLQLTERAARKLCTEAEESRPER